MKYKVFMASILALGIAGCGTVKDGKYLGGMVEVSGFSKTENKEPQSSNKASNKSINGCSENDPSYHDRDSRWCANLFLSGAAYSDEITYQENVSVPVDLAYIRAKKHLNFKDPDDALNSQYNERYEWDGIAGTYYRVKGRFGGPLMQMLYFSDYDLQIEKINESSSKVKITYKIYGRDVEPNEFSKILFKKIKS
jgi:hypothetical protein